MFSADIEKIFLATPIVGLDGRYRYLYATVSTILNKPYFYIGQHTTKNLDSLYRGSGANKYQTVVKKLGEKNFKFLVLEFCQSKEELDQLEQDMVGDHWKVNDWCMNLRRGGHGGFSLETRKKIYSPEHVANRVETYKRNYREKYPDGRKLSEEKRKSSAEKRRETMRQKIENGYIFPSHSKEQVERWRLTLARKKAEGWINPNIGRKVSSETIRKIRETRAINSRAVSEETRKKRSETNKRNGNRPPVMWDADNKASKVCYQYNRMTGGFIREFSSAGEAERNTGDNRCDILRCSKERVAIKTQYIWSHEKVERVKISDWRLKRSCPQSKATRQVSANGGIIREFENLIELADYLETSASIIQNHFRCFDVYEDLGCQFRLKKTT